MSHQYQHIKLTLIHTNLFKSILTSWKSISFLRKSIIRKFTSDRFSNPSSVFGTEFVNCCCGCCFFIHVKCSKYTHKTHNKSTKTNIGKEKTKREKTLTQRQEKNNARNNNNNRNQFLDYLNFTLSWSQKQSRQKICRSASAFKSFRNFVCVLIVVVVVSRIFTL